MSLSWTNKYAPKKTSDVIGQNAALSKISGFLKNFDSEIKKSVLIYGEPGCGKTSSVYALASDLGVELIELNASDVRNKESIESMLSAVMNQRSLFFSSKLILVDEVDGASSTKDRGGIGALSKLITTSKYPVVMTANNPFDKKFSDLRKKSLVIEFVSLDYERILEVLEKICNNEGVAYQKDALVALARRSGGDLRGGINDLQTLSEHSKKLRLEDVDELDSRRRTESMPNALVKVFKTLKPEIARTAFDDVEENIDERFLWLDWNIPKEYEKPIDIARAYDALSLADVYRGRIRRWQHWRFLVYINDLITAGIALSKDEKYKKFEKYTPTMRILRLWQFNMRFAKRKEIARKIGLATHTSQKYAIKNVLPYWKKMFEANTPTSRLIAEELEFDDGEVEWLKKKV
ncbi:replication factor C large subunit [Candidatus Woesearchaeota archaeon]|nr:replication factor C large subunit [Candidatus Woesearchaeota archaeon]